jgi:hypothetical protein
VPFNPVNTSDKTPLQACPAKFDYRPDEAIYRVGGGITPPRVTQYAIPELTKEARKAYKNNLFKDPNEVESRIAIVVDAQGKPQDLCLQKPAGFASDWMNRPLMRFDNTDFSPPQRTGEFLSPYASL